MSIYTKQRRREPELFHETELNDAKNENIRLDDVKRLLITTKERKFNNIENKDYSFYVPFDATCNLKTTFKKFTKSEYISKESGILYITTCIPYEWNSNENPQNIPYRIKFSIIVNNIPIRNFIIGVDGNLSINILALVELHNNDVLKFKIDRQRPTEITIKKNSLIRLDHFYVY